MRMKLHYNGRSQGWWTDGWVDTIDVKWLPCIPYWSPRFVSCESRYRDSQSNRDLYLSEYNVLYIDALHDEFRKVRRPSRSGCVHTTHGSRFACLWHTQVGPPSAIFLDSSPTNGPLTEYPDTYRK